MKADHASIVHVKGCDVEVSLVRVAAIPPIVPDEVGVCECQKPLQLLS